MAGLTYYRGDELPAWRASITLNSEVEDFSTGWDFTVTLSRTGEDTITKTDNILGASGAIEVQWTLGDLDITEGRWALELTATRDSDSRQFTIRDTLFIRSRALAE